MEHKGKELVGREVQPGQPGLDLGVEPFRQKPEGMGAFQATALDRIADALKMAGRLVWQFDRGVEGEQVTEQDVEQEMTCPVGKGAHPLPDGRPGGSWFGQPVHKPLPTQADHEVQVHDLLQEAQDVMTVGMQKVRQQAVSPPADPAAHPLHGEEAVTVCQAGPATVSAPADQRCARPAVRVGATLGERKGKASAVDGVGVLFDGTGEVLYNDHTVRTPLCVGGLATVAPRREVSSFLVRFPAIIAIAAPSVNPSDLPGVPLTLCPPINEPGHAPASSSTPIDTNHAIWPRTARFRSTSLAANSTLARLAPFGVFPARRG
jgi:hypothetical protein